ncbi:type II toxin-antitoxin system VapC family toxin [Methylovulum miyakonense]|uniref:type II toxin-antitoxin system VapC family toxin n=1 Tax=Methylovulum miyakonense TaxID=645578 RepID=UPI0003786677|nr:type II toxin-antitoxin system VapC family toxin [Methylovulum miyakonense]
MIVLDTHIWVWWLNDKERYLSTQQIDTIEQAERVAVSVVSCFEVAQIVKKGRLLLPLPVNAWLQEALQPAGVELLPLSVTIACRAVDLTPVHKDPFDRLIIATALDYYCQLMSVDSNFKHYPELQNHLI